MTVPLSSEHTRRPPGITILRRPVRETKSEINPYSDRGTGPCTFEDPRVKGDGPRGRSKQLELTVRTLSTTLSLEGESKVRRTPRPTHRRNLVHRVQTCGRRLVNERSIVPFSSLTRLERPSLHGFRGRPHTSRTHTEPNTSRGFV